MGNDDHRHAIGGKLLHNGKDLADHFRIEGRGRFIKEHDIRLHAQCTGNGYTLLLSTRELGRVSMCLLHEIHALQHGKGAFLGLLLAALLQLDGCQHEVVQHIHIIKEIKVLEHHADIFADLIDIHLFIGNVDTIHMDLSRGGILEMIETAEERGFT